MEDDLKLKARDKLVQKMTRDGLVERNLSENTERKVSDRIQETDFSSLKREDDFPIETKPDTDMPEFFKRRYAKEFRDSETDITIILLEEEEDLPSFNVSEDKGFRDPYAEMLDMKPGSEPEDYPDSPAFSKEQKREIKKKQVYAQHEKGKQSKLRFDDEKPAGKAEGMLKKTGDSVKGISAGVIDSAEGILHGKVSEVEDENAGVEAAHSSELAAESSLRLVTHKTKKHFEQPVQEKNRLDLNDDKPVSKLVFEEARKEPGIEAFSINRTAKAAQKKNIQRRYGAQFRRAKKAGESIDRAEKITETGSSLLAGLKLKTGRFVRNNKAVIATAAVCGMILLLFISGIGTLGSLIGETGGAIVESTFLSSDDDILAANDSYLSLESSLQSQLNNIESTYRGYDEYRYQVDEISHEPYSLISYLTAKYGDFKAGDIYSELSRIFQEQFKLRVYDEVEIRTRTVTRTGTREVEDEETGEIIIETYEYEEEEEYEWHILNVKLTNKGVDSIAMEGLNEDQRKTYLIYLSTLGNRSYLFGDTLLAGNPSSGGISYEIPPEALSDQRFANMIHEAEKYLGYPYVWGGSSPDTSFDCSGFVSWVINHCGNGWNVGRRGATGLLDVCTYISPDEAKPGDLIFFHGTYNTDAPASHVAIYVGDGMMIHCGDPIQYANINNSYWQQHFYCFGRIND